MSDIYIYEETARPPKPNHGNNCNGHFTSISAGGNGHSVGDGCGCEGINHLEFNIADLDKMADEIIALQLQQTDVSGSASRKSNPYQLIWYKQGWSENRVRKNNSKYWEWEIVHNGFKCP